MIVLDRTRLIAGSGFSDLRQLRKSAPGCAQQAPRRRSPTANSGEFEETAISN
jgi:hypothetical protein